MPVSRKTRYPLRRKLEANLVISVFPQRSEVTRLLVAWRDGDAAALDQLVPLVEAELHRLAHQ